MDWRNQELQQQEYLQYQIQGGVCGKVMTDEQMEELKKQIAAYTVLCDQLAEMHKTMSAYQDFTGIRLGNPYCDPMVASVSQKITARQRWTPTSSQLQILEGIYEQGNGTPSKQRIKDITSELAQHGQISETNVYNWFQNRRARSKRKLQSAGSINAEPEADAEDSAALDKVKPKPETLEFINNPAQGDGVESFYFQSSDTGGIDQLIGKEESSAGYNPYNLVEQFGLLR